MGPSSPGHPVKLQALRLRIRLQAEFGPSSNQPIYLSDFFGAAGFFFASCRAFFTSASTSAGSSTPGGKSGRLGIADAGFFFSVFFVADFSVAASASGLAVSSTTLDE